MSLNPSRILKIERGTLKAGSVADVTVFDPDQEWVFGEEPMESKSRNSPFLGQKLKGKATEVLVGGRLVLENAAFVARPASSAMHYA